MDLRTRAHFVNYGGIWPGRVLRGGCRLSCGALWHVCGRGLGRRCSAIVGVWHGRILSLRRASWVACSRWVLGEDCCHGNQHKQNERGCVAYHCTASKMDMPGEKLPEKLRLAQASPLFAPIEHLC